MQGQLNPTTSYERIPSLDFLRGIAILGILFINIENFAYQDSFNPWKHGFEDTGDYTTRFWVYFLTQGKFYSMFALLFGVGFYIFLERLEKKQVGLKAMDIYARRLLWLFVIGIIHAYFIWSGDVLYHYAICGFFLFPFRSFKISGLWAVVIVLAALQLVKSYNSTNRVIDWQSSYNIAMQIPENERSENELKSIKRWEKITAQGVPDTTKMEPKYATYIEAVSDRYNNARAHKGMLYYQGLLFPSLIVMIIGIIFYRQGIFSDIKAWNYYWPITLGLLCIALIINYYRYYHWTYEYFDPVLDIWQGFLFSFPKELLGVAYILLLNGLYQMISKRFKGEFISAIGRTALSNYIFQNILLGFFFYGYGFGYFNEISRSALIPIIIIIWIIQLICAQLWLRKYRQGPLEYLWRKLTYSGFVLDNR